MAKTSLFDDFIDVAKGPLSRFLFPFKAATAHWGMITEGLDLNNWVVDGAAGATKGTVGTNAQFQQTCLTFAIAADDFAYARFKIPMDFNKETQEIYLILKWYTADHDPTHLAQWDGLVRRIPCNLGDSDDAVVWDVAGDVALTDVHSLTDDTTLEIQTCKLDLAVTDYELGDTVQLTLTLDVSECTIANDAVLVDAFAIYGK